MQSNQNKKSESTPSNQVESINGIIQLVKSFDYGLVIDSVEGDGQNAKRKKQKNEDQTKRENIGQLLKIVVKIKDVIVDKKVIVKSENESITTVINERGIVEKEISILYQELKSKLADDLYLLNVELLEKFLQNYKDTKLNSSIKILFSTIFSDVNSELKEILPEPSFRLLSNLFNDHRIEFNLSQIIKSLFENESPNGDRINQSKVLSNLYIFLVLQDLSGSNYVENIFKVESVLANYLLGFKPLEKNKYLHKKLPKVLLDINSKSEIESLVHPYLYFKNKELRENGIVLEDQLTEVRRKFSQLSTDRAQLKEEVDKGDKMIAQLKVETEEKNKEIERLKADLLKQTNFLEYERHQHELQFQELRSGLVSSVQKGTKRSLEIMTVLVDRLPEEQRKSLSRRLNDLKGYLASLSEN